MARFLKKKNEVVGQVPGELVFIGEQKVTESTIRVIDYDQEKLSEQELRDIKEGLPYKETPTVTWININGLHETEWIREIGKGFNLHALVLEDIVNTGQRPRMEEYDSYLFFVLKMMRYDQTSGKIISEQLSMVLGKTFLLTFQEQPGDVFEPVRERIRKQKGRIRKVGIDYLAYALLDTIVDNYLLIIEHLGEQIEEIETRILDNPTQAVLANINAYKREMNYLRKTIRPAREFILQLSKLDSELVEEKTRPFVKDLLDLSNQAIDVIDSYRDMLSDLLNIYDSRVNNRMNEIMKVLTIFSAIFIPLTFIAGIYGTNFEYLPETKFHYGYFFMWGLMIVVAGVMLRFFRRKGWL